MTRQEWAQIAERIITLWRHTPAFSERELEVWYEELSELDAEFVARAVRKLSRDGAQFMPPVGAIYKTARQLEKSEPIRRWQQRAQLARQQGLKALPGGDAA